MDHHHIHILGMKPISSCVVNRFRVGRDEQILPQEPWFMFLQENAMVPI